MIKKTNTEQEEAREEQERMERKWLDLIAKLEQTTGEEKFMFYCVNEEGTHSYASMGFDLHDVQIMLNHFIQRMEQM